MFNLNFISLFHRDFKPDNIAYGLGSNKEKIYLFDFGLAKLFKRKNNDGKLEHIKPAEGRDLVGTIRYRV